MAQMDLGFRLLDSVRDLRNRIAVSLRSKKALKRPMFNGHDPLQGPSESAQNTKHLIPPPPVCPTGIISGTAFGECDIAGRRIKYGLQVGFEEKPDGVPRHAGVRGWALDLTSFTPVAVLCVTSESGAVHKLIPTALRDDALNQAAVPQDKRKDARKCGFSGVIPDAGAKITLALEVDGQIHVIGTGHPEKPQVLVGRQGWLFLAGDSNDSPSQFTGNHCPSEAWLNGWAKYFEAFHMLRESQAGGQVCFLIAPSKESLFPDYYPLARGTQSPLDSLLERHGDLSGLVYPNNLLSEMRELSYDKAETHWTDFGARMVCQDILQRWDIPNPPLPLQFTLPSQSGDLGWKTIPPVMTHRPKAAWHNPAKVIFDNFVLHHGRIRVSSNPQARIQQTCVIFGGSSAEHMERYLTAIFKRVVYVYSAGSWDPKILGYEGPACTIMQSSERFLTRPPAPEVDTATVVADKLAKGHVINKQSRAKLMSQWDDDSIAIYKTMG